MNTISREELKARLDRHEPVQLVMALGGWEYNRAHIPGSVWIGDLCVQARELSHDQEVVVYCTNPVCPASYRAYYLLESLGFTKVRNFSGGIEEWVDAGYPVEGSLAEVS